ncbi:hypothetical protein OIO90_001555 [Microbotryomycetes sp. JL221]|nr:hypothetical protein OIO90_001555 [Microbotryomycetes sp. JL221]
MQSHSSSQSSDDEDIFRLDCDHHHEAAAIDVNAVSINPDKVLTQIAWHESTMDGKSGLFFGHKLPFETFIRIASFVRLDHEERKFVEKDLISMTHRTIKILRLEVCTPWDQDIPSSCSTREDEYSDDDYDKIEGLGWKRQATAVRQILQALSINAAPRKLRKVRLMIGNSEEDSYSSIDAGLLIVAYIGQQSLESMALIDSARPTSSIEELLIEGVTFEESTMPHFSHMSHVNMEAVPPSNFLPNKMDRKSKDLPATLILPNLKRLECSSNQAALFWTVPRLDRCSFITETPALSVVSFALESNKYTDRPASESYFDRQSLSTFFRHSSNLTCLDLSQINVTSDHLLVSLGHATSHSLVKLRLGQLANDHVLSRLHTLLPDLKYLDVTPKPCHGRMFATLPALARFANKLRGANSSILPRWLSSWNIKLVAMDDPAQSLSRLRQDFRTHLMSLTTSQVSHLTTQLHLNSPPNGLDFNVTKQEIISMANPPQPPLPANTIAQRNVRNKVMPLPASQMVVDDTVNAMHKWQIKREEEWAIEWCDQTAGVELMWSDNKPWSLDV